MNRARPAIHVNRKRSMNGPAGICPRRYRMTEKRHCRFQGRSHRRFVICTMLNDVVLLQVHDKCVHKKRIREARRKLIVFTKYPEPGKAKTRLSGESERGDELVCCLQVEGRIGLAPAPVITSARRWEQTGVARTILINLVCW